MMNKELSKTGRVLRVYAILSRIKETREKQSIRLIKVDHRFRNVEMISLSINGIGIDIDDCKRNFKYDSEEPNEDSRCGWMNPLKIGKASNKHHSRVKYNQRRNLRSTTPKR